MAIYLKEFETQAAYEAAQSGLILPNVSFIVENNDIVYNPYVDPYGGHDYVEIGGLKWATMNIGATGVTDAGLYFQWGDSQGYTAAQVGSGSGQKPFKWADYKYGDGTEQPGNEDMTKYNATDGKTVLDDDDDAAKVYWGGKWRMPSMTEVVTFVSSVNTAWTNSYQSSGVAGIICTDRSDSSKVLFLPAGGTAGNYTLTNKNEACLIWSRTLANYSKAAYVSYVMSDFKSWNTAQNRLSGNNIRAVAE